MLFKEGKVKQARELLVLLEREGFQVQTCQYFTLMKVCEEVGEGRGKECSSSFLQTNFSFKVSRGFYQTPRHVLYVWFYQIPSYVDTLAKVLGRYYFTLSLFFQSLSLRTHFSFNVFFLLLMKYYVLFLNYCNTAEKV